MNDLIVWCKNNTPIFVVKSKVCLTAKGIQEIEDLTWVLMFYLIY